MATERKVVDFKIHNLSEEKFQELKDAGQIDPNAIYMTPDESLKKNQIANCLTEIPQDIKLELKNGTLTLKAGSKVYQPNNSIYNVTTDKTLTINSNGKFYIVINPADGYLLRANYPATTSSSEPTSASIADLWYDSTNNSVKRYSNGWSVMALPLAIVTVSNGAISSIDQVFNGIGYIGSTVFALPGVKGLIPNGRNEDGTLKNTTVTTSGVQTLTNGSNLTTNLWYVIKSNGSIENSLTDYWTYNSQRNFWLHNDVVFDACIFAESSVASGVISNFESRPTFHAVDYNDFESTVEKINSSISAVDSSAVHKTENETIGGVKTFTGYIKASAGVGVQINATSHNFNLRSSGATPEGCGLFVDNDAGKPAFATTDTKITIGSSVVAPHSVTTASSSNSTNIATTAFVKSVLSSSGNGLATFSKAKNGYYKFNNGLIIQWGELAVDTSGRYTVNFPTAFTSTNYTITAMGVSSGKITTYAYVQYGNKTTTNVQLATVADATQNGVRWMAIGY